MPERTPAPPLRRLAVLFALLVGLAGAGAGAGPAFAAPSDTRVVLNETPIVLGNGSGVGAPYASPIEIGGLAGRVTEVAVTLRGVTHEEPWNLDIMLVAPDGRRSMVMSDACGRDASTRAFWILQESAAAPLPQDAPCTGIFYRPTNHQNGYADIFPAPAPPQPWPTGFGAFTGGSPNGTWTLYVANRFAYSGEIEFGWALTVTAVDAEVRLPESSQPRTASDPYPVKRTVSGKSGIVTDVDVSLKGLHHQHPDDIDVALQGPTGTGVKLMSDVCGAADMLGRTFTFDDEAGRHLPDDAPAGCEGGSYRPSDVQGNDFDYWVSGPLFAVGATSALSDFDLSDPNGTWQLYVNDDTGGDLTRGLIEDGFTLDIKTRPRAKVAFASPAISVAEGEVREITLEREQASSPLGPASVTVTSAPGTAATGTDFAPVSAKVDFAAGETTKTILVAVRSDGEHEPSETFTLALGSVTGDADGGAPATVTIADEPVRSATGGGSGPTDAAGGGAATPGAAGPAARAVTGSGLAPDRTAPVIRGLAVTPARGTRRRPARVRYTLSEPATVAVRLERAVGGRHVRVATLRGGGRAGANAVRKRLRRGTYRVVVTAVDRAGNRAVPRRKRLRVRR